VKGGFFLGKKPLEYVLSVYTISENAIATTFLEKLWIGWVNRIARGVGQK
jgi:hypothetical protein